jgi:hypothetical protein
MEANLQIKNRATYMQSLNINHNSKACFLFAVIKRFLAMAVHELKTWKPIFQVMKSGEKSFDMRKNDRNFQVGDELILNEYDNEKGEYTGDHIHALITWILPSDNPYHNLGDKVVMSLKYHY